ncbi:MAG: hypothetical protein JST16_15160 [Bdellovibrionales bacterium]|nr:hypothetical protein [Bdellovibrionales bacterium]
MKKFFRYGVSFVLLCCAGAAQARTPTYDELKNFSSRYEDRIRQEGLSYMVGGGLGLAASVGLGIRASELVPKIGYSLMQVLSSAALVHGSVLYYVGDGFTNQMDSLHALDLNLKKQASLSNAQRAAIMNAEIESIIEREQDRRRRTRQIRGALELATAGSAAASLAFANVRSSSSDLVLGFIVIVSASGGAADLINANSDDAIEALTIGLAPVAGPGVSIAYSW